MLVRVAKAPEGDGTVVGGVGLIRGGSAGMDGRVTTFPTDDQSLELLDAALHPGPGAERTSVNDLLALYGEMGRTRYHVNDVLGALVAEVRALRVLAGPVELAVARGRREAYESLRSSLRAELIGAPHNAPPQAQVTYVGGLARARRMVELRYRAALDDEERLVLDSADPPAGS